MFMILCKDKYLIYSLKPEERSLQARRIRMMQCTALVAPECGVKDGDNGEDFQTTREH